MRFLWLSSRISSPYKTAQFLESANGIKNVRGYAKSPNKWTYSGVYLRKIGARCLPVPNASNLLSSSVSDRSKFTSGSGRSKSSESVNLVSIAHLKIKSKMAWQSNKSLRPFSTWSQQLPFQRLSNTPRLKASKLTEPNYLKRRLSRRYACTATLWSVTTILIC